MGRYISHMTFLPSMVTPNETNKPSFVYRLPSRDIPVKLFIAHPWHREGGFLSLKINAARLRALAGVYLAMLISFACQVYNFLLQSFAYAF
jgi:hypothetical protein